MSSELKKERLIECRKKLEITKQEAARRMNMSQPAYLRYESGERKPSIHVMQTMASVLHTSVEYLIGESDSPAPTSYIVSKDTNPELFHLILEYEHASADERKRLLEYAKCLSGK